MPLFIKVIFWLYLVSALVKMGGMLTSDYPRTKEVKLATDTIDLNVYIGVAVWAGILLWG